ncbi:MAG: hypothetical protein QXJ51_04380 [Sulfolobales archaeon]
MVSNSISEVLEYLVLKMMAGRPEILKALIEYVEGNLSPAAAPQIYNVSKHQLRGFIQRIYDKANNRPLANLLIKLAVPIILEKTRIYIDRSQRPEECMVCGRKLYNVFPEDHIKKHHKDLIEYEKQKILAELRRIIREKTESLDKKEAKTEGLTLQDSEEIRSTAP